MRERTTEYPARRKCFVAKPTSRRCVRRLFGRYRSRIRTIVAVVITSNLRLLDAPGNVLLRSRSTGLPRDSVVNVSQLLTLDRSYLTEHAGTLPPRLQRAVEEGLRTVLHCSGSSLSFNGNR